MNYAFHERTSFFGTNLHPGPRYGVNRRGVEHDSSSSVELHRDFWNWRRDYPGSPFWVHFQITDVHEEGDTYNPVAPFAGLFLSPDQQKIWREWHARLDEEDGHGVYSEAYENPADAANVEKYSAFLETQWEAHQALARHFTPGDDVELTPEQLETLEALGYIQ